MKRWVRHILWEGKEKLLNNNCQKNQKPRTSVSFQWTIFSPSKFISSSFFFNPKKGRGGQPLHPWSLSQFLKIQLTCLQRTAHLQPSLLRAVCLYHIRWFQSEGAACWGFACFCSAQESVKSLAIHASLLPQFHPKGTGEAFAFCLGCFYTQKLSESFAHQNLRSMLFSEFPSEGHCQVTQIC